MAICELTQVHETPHAGMRGWCERHQDWHAGRQYEHSQDPAQENRRIKWDLDLAGELASRKGIEERGGEYPCATEILANVMAARKEWIAAGSPERSDEECVRLHAICEVCSWFDAKQDRCRKCGCGLSNKSSTSVWANLIGIPSAIRMASHHCPIGKW